MEAEIIALADSCCKLFPILNGVGIMGKTTGLLVAKTAIQVSINEENAGALVLVETLLPQCTS